MLLLLPPPLLLLLLLLLQASPASGCPPRTLTAAWPWGGGAA
jgi:hypothetical protein